MLKEHQQYETCLSSQSVGHIKLDGELRGKMEVGLNLILKKWVK